LPLIGGNQISGIHIAHFAPGVHIRFAAADRARQTIPRVEHRNAITGGVRTSVGPGPPTHSTQDLPTLEMQCVDRHNRPTHTFELPERAIHRELELGDISATLPFIKKGAVQRPKAKYSTTTDATERLPAAVVRFYQQTYPDLYSERQEDIHQAGRAVLAITNATSFRNFKFHGALIPTTWATQIFPGVSDAMTAPM
jgi:hypothetical protein